LEDAEPPFAKEAAGAPAPEEPLDMADPLEAAEPLDMADPLEAADPLPLADPLEAPDPLPLADPLRAADRLPSAGSPERADRLAFAGRQESPGSAGDAGSAGSGGQAYPDAAEPVVLTDAVNGPGSPASHAPAEEGGARRPVADLTRDELFELIERAVESGVAKALARNRGGGGPR
jgi:hypothetical protein